MLDTLYTQLNGTAPVAVVIIALSQMLMTGFLMTRVTKLLRLPNVTAYIVTGILIGPYVLDCIPRRVIDGSAFLPDVALAFIAFSTGEFFRIDALKKSGFGVVFLTLSESLLASLLVFLAVFFGLGLPLPFSVVLAALAAATAPASTMMTIRQTGAKGPFVDTLLQVVALDDIVGLVAYSIAISVAVSAVSGEKFRAATVLAPLLWNIAAIVVGALFGFAMKGLLTHRNTDNRLIVSIALLFAFCGLCAAFGISPLLGCMAMGTVYINTTDDTRLFRQLGYFSPPILLLFFVRSGLSFDLGALVSVSGSAGRYPLLAVGLVYFFVRIVGKYAGAFVGAAVAREGAEVRKFLGLALIPQAGVAIGLAAMGARTLGGEMGTALETIILASSVLYEIIGPACGKLSLYLSHSYSDKLEDNVIAPETGTDGESLSPVEALIRRIQIIQSELPRREINENEQAFTEAAEEHFNNTQNIYRNQRRFFRR